MSGVGTHRCNFVSHICRSWSAADESLFDVAAMSAVSANARRGKLAGQGCIVQLPARSSLPAPPGPPCTSVFLLGGKGMGSLLPAMTGSWGEVLPSCRMPEVTSVVKLAEIC